MRVCVVLCGKVRKSDTKRSCITHLAEHTRRATLVTKKSAAGTDTSTLLTSPFSRYASKLTSTSPAKPYLQAGVRDPANKSPAACLLHTVPVLNNSKLLQQAPLHGCLVKGVPLNLYLPKQSKRESTHPGVTQAQAPMVVHTSVQAVAAGLTLQTAQLH